MKHSGGCHCGAVRFDVEMELKKGMECDCSICSKRGSILDFVPEANFKLLSGESHLTEYLFNKKVIQHLFCKDCGILSFGKGLAPNGAKMVALNLRCLDGFKRDQVQIWQHEDKDH